MIGALDRRRLVALGGRRLADADHLGAAGLLRARRDQPPERLLRRGRQLAAVAEQQRRAQRRGHQLRRRDRHAPVGRVDERDRARARVAIARGEDRLRDAGGVGDRVGAADARRVAGRERGEAEVAHRLLVVALAPEDRRFLGRAAAIGLVAPAAAAGEEQQHEGAQGRREEREAHGDKASGRGRRARRLRPARTIPRRI
jgi:hypothetical protein